MCVKESVCVYADIRLRGHMCQIFLEEGKAAHSSICARRTPRMKSLAGHGP